MDVKTIFDFDNYEEIKMLADKNKGRAILTEVVIKYMPDDINSCNYLLTELDYINKKVIKSDRYSNRDIERFGWETVKRWVEEDVERYEDYGIGWYSLGIIAEATILIPFQVYNSKHKLDWNFKIEKISSGGIWGIDSDSDEKHIEEEEHNQLLELGRYLQALNVDISLTKDELEWFWERYNNNKYYYACVTIKEGKVVNVLATQDERKAMEHGEYSKLNYKDEGISQIVVYRSHPDGEAELMYEFIPEK